VYRSRGDLKSVFHIERYNSLNKSKTQTSQKKKLNREKSMNLGANVKMTNIKIEGNFITYTTEDVNRNHIEIFDPTGEHGAENAYDLICEKATPVTEAELVKAVFDLEKVSQGQFEVMDFSVGASSL
jgi:predicted small secreted protein